MQFTWILWKIEGTQVLVDKTGSGDYDEFLSNLPGSECRYGGDGPSMVISRLPTLSLAAKLWK